MAPPLPRFMERRLRCVALTIALGTAALQAGAAAAVPADLGDALSREMLEVNLHDNGTPYHVGVGSQIFIALPASPRGIGRWQWLSSATDRSVVRGLARQEFLERPEGATDQTEGFQAFSFVAAGPGRTVVMLRFRSLQNGAGGNGDEDDPVSNLFKITVDVH